jgi:hypothetical protein
VDTTRVGLRILALLEEAMRQAKLPRSIRYRSPPRCVRKHPFLPAFVAGEELGKAPSLNLRERVLRLTGSVNGRQHQLGVTALFVFYQ